MLPIGKSPIVILNIEMDPILVDVNVHPSKLEVRFSKEKELFDAVAGAIRSVFRTETLIPTYESEREKPKKIESRQHSFAFNEVHKEEAHQNREQSIDDLIGQTSPEPKEIKTDFSEHQDDVLHEMTTNFDAREPAEKPMKQKEDQNRVPTLYPIGQLHGTYILAQNEEGMYIVDQHAAQERIKYEFFRDQLAEVDHEVQELLVPMTFDFSRQEALRIEEYQSSLEKVGLFFEPFGENTFIIRSHPQWFPKGFEEEVIQEMVQQLMNEDRIDILKIREEAAILMSCKRSIKANHYLNQTDMFRLLEDLRQSTDPFTCPHGRPIIVFFSEYEMEKMFKRVM